MEDTPSRVRREVYPSESGPPDGYPSDIAPELAPDNPRRLGAEYTLTDWPRRGTIPPYSTKLVRPIETVAMQNLAYLFLAIALLFIAYSAWGMAATSLVFSLMMWMSDRRERRLRR